MINCEGLEFVGLASRVVVVVELYSGTVMVDNNYEGVVEKVVFIARLSHHLIISDYSIVIK